MAAVWRRWVTAINISLLLCCAVLPAAADQPPLSGPVVLAFDRDFCPDSPDPLAAALRQWYCRPDVAGRVRWEAGTLAVRDYWAALLDRPLEDTSIAVDVWLVGDAAGQAVRLGCRDESPADALGASPHYRFTVLPHDRVFALARQDAADGQVFWDYTASLAIRPGNEINRLELRCVGTQITALVNGTQVASVSDDRYHSGYLFVAADGLTNAAQSARFDNVVIRSLPVS